MRLMNSSPPPFRPLPGHKSPHRAGQFSLFHYRLSRQILQRGLSMFSPAQRHLGRPHRKSRCPLSSPLHGQYGARASFSFVRACLYACALLLPSLAAAPASAQLVLQLDLSSDRVADGGSVDAVLCRTRSSGSCPAAEIYGIDATFRLRGESDRGEEVFSGVITISAVESTSTRAASLGPLPAGIWSFSLADVDEMPLPSNVDITLSAPPQLISFIVVTVEGPEAPGVFSSDGISYASPNSPVILSVSSSTPPLQRITFMLRGESRSGEFTNVQPAALDTDGSPGTVSFSVLSEGLWTFGILQQEPANTAELAVPSAAVVVRVGPPPLRLSGYDSWGTGENVQLRLSSPLAVTGEFMVERTRDSSSQIEVVSFTQETQKDINFGQLTGGRWSFRVIDSVPTGAADLSRAEREVMVEGGMRYTVRFQPEHADTVRYDSTRRRYFVLEGSDAEALFRSPNGAQNFSSRGNACREDVRADIQRQIGSEMPRSIASRVIGDGSSGRDFVCEGEIYEDGLNVTFAVAGRYSFLVAAGNNMANSRSQDIRSVYAEALLAVESFSPGQDVIAVGDTAVLNLQLREPALVDSRFTVQAQNISFVGSSSRFNAIQLLRGESSGTVSFRNMERGEWSFTLVQASPPQLLATAPARVAAGSTFVGLEAPAIVPDAEVVLRLVTDFTLPVPATFTVTATGMPAGGGSAFAPMTQTIHLPVGESTADVTFSGLSAGNWVFRITSADAGDTLLDFSSTATVIVGSLRAVLRAADLDGRVQAGRDVVILLELPQPLGRDIVLSVVGEGPGGMSRVLPITLRSGASTASAVFIDLIPGQWRFSATASIEGIDTQGIMVTLDVVPRSALSLSVQGARNVADIGNVLPSALAVQLRITAAPAAIDDATLTLRAVSGVASQMITATLPADTTAATADFGVLPDGVWRFSVAETMPDDLFDAAAEVEVEIRRPRGILSAGRTIARGSSNLPLTVAFDFPAGSAASDNFDNRLIAISPVGVETSRTRTDRSDRFGAVPSSMVYSFGSDAGAADHAFAGVDRTDGIWTFRHECSAARVLCGEQGAVRVRVGDPPNATLEAVSPQTLAGRPVGIILRLGAEAVGDLRLTVLAQKSGTEESASAVMVLPGDQSALEFDFPPLSAGTWVFRPSTQTEHVNPRQGDTEGAATELVRRDSLATAQTMVEVVSASSFLVSLVRPEQETVRAGVLLLGLEAVLRIEAIPPPLEELEVVLSGRSAMAQIEPQTVILSPESPSMSVRVLPSTAGDWLFSIAVNIPSDGLAAGQVNPAASSVMLTVAQLALRLDLSPDRVNAGESVDAVLCLALSSGSCPASNVEGTAYGIDARFRLRGESDRGGDVFSEVITVTAARTTSTDTVELGPLPAGIWSFSLADVDEMPLGDGDSVTLSAPPQLVSFAAVTQVQLEAVSPDVAAGEAVRLRLVPDGVYDRAREFVVQGSSHLGAEADPLTVQVSADDAVAEALFTNLPPGLWTFVLIENLVGANTEAISTLREAQVRVEFPAIIVEGPVPPGMFSSDGISYARPNNPVVLRVSTSLPLRQQVTFMLQGESSSGEFTDVQPVTLDTGGSPSTVSFSIPGEGLWTFGIVQQDPANTAYPAAPSGSALVRVGPPPLRLSGYDSRSTVENVQLRLSSPLTVTGEFMVKGVKGSSSLTRIVSFTQELQKDISFGRLEAGQWSFRVIDSVPTGAADLSRAERDVMVAGGMRFTVRFQPEHANTVRYDSTRNRYFALEGSEVEALFRAPGGTPNYERGGGNCSERVEARVRLNGDRIIASRGIGEFQSSSGLVVVCKGLTIGYNLDVAFAVAGRYTFFVAANARFNEVDPRTVYVEALPAVESFSPEQNLIAVAETAVLNLQLREPAVVDSRFSVQAQDISFVGSSPRFNAIQLLRGEISATVSFHNMERGVWQFAASAVPAGVVDTSLAQATLNVLPAAVLPVELTLLPSAPATAVRGEGVALKVTVLNTTHGGFSARVQALAPVSNELIPIPVQVAAEQSSGTAFFVPMRAGDWQFGLIEAAAEDGGAPLDVGSSTLTLTVEEARLDISAPPGIDADDLVLALRYLELCPPPGGCSASGVTEASLRLNLGQGAGPIPLDSLRLPDVAGDGAGSGQADIAMLLSYLSGIRGDALFPPGAPVEFREVRLEIIEELLGR